MVMNLPNQYLLQNGKYKLTHAVGQGGFGITYKGLWFTEAKGPLGTVKTEVPVCVKEYFFKDYCERDTATLAVKVHSETGKALFHKFKEKLIKEAKILSEVHHPYIVNVLEVFEENNTAYIAMEYIDGFSLKHRMDKEGVLPEDCLLRYVGQIGQALEFVHRKNILHLDIKPSNILIDKDDNARLIDFGVSKRYDIDQQETSTTILTLSKGFASIEQYDDEGTQNFSPRPDIYSLGATMYNLLTGKIPTESILRATRPLVAPRALNPAITPQTEAVILKAMQIIPADRFGSVAEMLDALDIPAPRPLASGTPAGGNLPASPAEAPLGEEEEETTLVAAPPSLLRPSSEAEEEAEEEETQVNLPPKGETPPPAPPGKRTRLAIAAVSLLAVGASAIALLVHAPQPFSVSQEEKTGEVAPTPPTDEETETAPLALSPAGSPEETTEERSNNTRETDPATTRRQVPAAAEATNGRPAEDVRLPVDQPAIRIDATPAGSGTREAEAGPPASVTPAAAEATDAEAVYQTALAAGKAKMASADYEGAKQAFAQAKEAKLTEEVVRLIIATDEKAEEKRIADRKASYEEKMDFGPYKIVRKKSNGRYGAIDTRADERIPCKYLSVGKADNGRAFEREDNLFDIYNPEGVLINEGATYY